METPTAETPDTPAQSDPPAVCPNCGCPDMRNFCPECGQENAPPLPSVRELVAEIVNNAFNLDSKLFATLRGLLRPGFLTKEFLAGRRARYFGPMKLYLWISALYFLAFSFAGQQKEIAQSFTVKETARQTQASPAVAGRSATPSPTVRERKEQIVKRVQATGNWVADHMPTISIALIPLFAGWLHLLFRRRRPYMEHLVFTLHTQSFVFLAGLSGMVVESFLRANALISLVIGATYLPLAMRAVYGETWGRTIIKTVLLVAGQFILPGIVGILLVLIFLLLPGKP